MFTKTFYIVLDINIIQKGYKVTKTILFSSGIYCFINGLRLIDKTTNSIHAKKPIILNRRIFLNFTVKRHCALNLFEEYMTQHGVIITSIFRDRDILMMFIAIMYIS
jgi:hypothetical protein